MVACRALLLCFSSVEIILRSYWDNGKGNGNYYTIIGYILRVIYWIMEKKMETTIGFIVLLSIAKH